jgi:hypothetical protein
MASLTLLSLPPIGPPCFLCCSDAAGDLAGVAPGAHVLSRQLQSKQLNAFRNRWSKKGRCWAAAPLCSKLLLLSAGFFPGALSRQRFFYSALRTWLQVERVTLYFFDDVLGLNLALEPTQGILDGLTLLQSNFCQSVHPQPSPDWTIYSLYHSRSHVAPVVKLACSFWVAVIIFFLIVVIVSIVTFVFLFVFFLVRVFSNEDIGDSRAMKVIGAEAFCVHCSHAY